MSRMVVIVDDSKTVRASVEYILKKEGYQVVQAADGIEGVAKLEELRQKGMRPGMIISDINMPNMDGIHFITEIKKSMYYKFVPVLVLTTESQNEKMMEGKNAGAAGWLVKPFSHEQLVGVVKKFVK